MIAHFLHLRFRFGTLFLLVTIALAGVSYGAAANGPDGAAAPPAASDGPGNAAPGEPPIEATKPAPGAPTPPDTGNVPPPPPPPPINDPLILKLPSGSWPEQGESLRRALEEELGRTVILEAQDTALKPHADEKPTVIVAVGGQPVELAVTYSPANGQVITRVVAGPASDEQRVQIVCLLVGSLVRQEVTGPLPAPMTATAVPVAPTPAEPPTRFANASLVFPLATNYDAPDLHTRLSFNLIAGRLGGLEGLELGGFNRIDGDARGLEFAYGGNFVSGQVEALQAAFLFNVGAGVSGVQLSAGNWSQGHVSGFQLGFIGNVAEGKVIGAQAAFGFNLSGDLDGIQAATVNVAKNTRGFQFGAVNIADDFRGVQLGVVNKAAKVQGLTLGLINIADDIEGLPIGLVNVTKSGGIHPVFWFASRSYGNFGVKFATRHVYSILSFSAHPTKDRVLFGPGYALGTAIPIVDKVAVDVDLGLTHLFGDGGCCDAGVSESQQRQHDKTLFRLRAMGRYSFFQHLSLFAGAALVEEVTYPTSKDQIGNIASEPRFDAYGEFFGGVEL